MSLTFKLHLIVIVQQQLSKNDFSKSVIVVSYIFMKLNVKEFFLYDTVISVFRHCTVCPSAIRELSFFLE